MVFNCMIHSILIYAIGVTIGLTVWTSLMRMRRPMLYYVFGSVHALTDAHTLVDEQFCLLYLDILPVQNRDQIYNAFAARN